MMTRLLNRIVSKMQQGMAEGTQEALKEMTDEMAKGILNPEGIAAFAKAMGIDMSQVSGMMSGQAAVDPYFWLGLTGSATDEEVKKRYREMLHALHPDKSGTRATEQYLDWVKSAYEMIKMERGWK